ncbi:hypothetical protein GCM10010376_85280 [Streptomyces violaceusniger]
MVQRFENASLVLGPVHGRSAAVPDTITKTTSRLSADPEQPQVRHPAITNPNAPEAPPWSQKTPNIPDHTHR